MLDCRIRTKSLFLATLFAVLSVNGVCSSTLEREDSIVVKDEILEISNSEDALFMRRESEPNNPEILPSLRGVSRRLLPVLTGLHAEEKTKLKENGSISVAKDNSASCAPFVPSGDEIVGKTIWIPGYPGSGSEMLRNLLHAITGLTAGQIYKGNSCQHGDTPAVTCKTHWPKPHMHEDLFGDLSKVFASSAFILHRNPSKAIPSYFNRIWEEKNNVQSHSQQAPEEAWKEWRDRYLAHEINRWKQTFLNWYMGPYDMVLNIPLEKLASEETGPDFLAQIGEEIQKVGFEVADKGSISCLWNKSVKLEHSVKRTRFYEPSYTLEQKKLMLDMLQELREELSDIPEVAEWMEMYAVAIESNMVLDST